ncbi:hypothetical protein F5876DRAFT_79434 [Lentinula aff. lateritia]|uniref:Uncharacterized protein n=1 Tax=Lentinula aff. lateritia TaxID=2804960 RepID=A0ACC1TSJ6_9AGAR|nr:hypothetical protein F5876DRAFT_79434 [Lentinula aff. lateritia]
MRFNLACFALGLFAAVSAVPVAVQNNNVEARAPSSDNEFDLRELGGAIGVNVYHARGTQIFNSRGEEIDARETFGLTSADLESREAFAAALSSISSRAPNKVTIKVTFTNDLSTDSNNPDRAKAQSDAKSAVQSLLNAASKELSLEGKTLDVIFLNDYHSSRGEATEHVTFTFDETVCAGTCTGHAFGSGKGEIFKHDHSKIFSKKVQSNNNNGAAVEARAPSSTDSGYDLRELGGAVGVNVYRARGTQIFNSRGEEIDARETFGLTSADLESREALVAALSDLSRRAKNKVTIQVTFTGDLTSESNNPTRAKTQSVAKAAVQSLLNAAAKSLDLEGKTIDVVFLNDFHESRGETISHVTFEFEETVCEGTCTGHAFGGSKGDIFNHNHEKIYSKRSKVCAYFVSACVKIPSSDPSFSSFLQK